MSWSLEKVGTKEAVKAACIVEFDKYAKMYEGKEEEKDVLAAKERCLSAIDEVSNNGVKVSASGSRGSWSTTIKLEVVGCCVCV